MVRFARQFAAAGALVVAAGTLGAQGAAKCDAEGSKGSLARIAFVVEQARTSQGPAASASLTNAVKQLEANTASDATIGRSFLLGETLALWFGQPGITPTPKRSALGFTRDPDATIDLAFAIDSLFRVVETAKPECLELTTTYRGGLAGYVNIANAAIGALNAEKLDSAEFLATRAHRLYPGSPYGTMVLGNVANKRGNTAKALEFYSQAAIDAGKDSAYREVERQMRYNIGAVYLTEANKASGAARADAARKAAAAYNQLLTIPGTSGLYLSSGRLNYQNAILLAGDTAAFVASYAPLLANPAAYDYQDLLNSAVGAARINKPAEATKLFEAVLAKNPYSRDALFNLGLTYLTLDQNEKVVPVVTRLIDVDPANPENYNLAARAFLAQSKAAAAAKKIPLVAALNDSTMQWYMRGNRLPNEVTFTLLTPSEKQITIAGIVTDRRDKVDVPPEAPPAKGAKKAPVKAKPTLPSVPVTVKFEALDIKGNVVGTQTVTTEALSPGATSSFSITIPANNATSFRYKIGA